MAKKKAKKTPEPLPKDFLDMIAPAAVKFNTDHFILGNAYHCVMAARGYGLYISRCHASIGFN